ncbi:MAG: HD domain-containing protein [Anaeromyxobacteraceae bacterium]|nr:HD domain-containing protein [Anaeromyxobacteraceae bacterium]
MQADPVVPVREKCPRPWRRIALAFLTIGAVHLLVGRATHGQHLIHLVFGAAYLLPIVAAAAWLGVRQAILLAGASGVMYLLHTGTAWVDQPMENANRVVLAVVYLFVGAVAGVLVEAAERERSARQSVERSAQRDAMIQAIASLSGALRERDDGTAAHCERVARIAVRLGEALEMPSDRIHVLRLAAVAHDVGKIGVRDDVLFKPGELTPAERGRIERHPDIAAQLLRPVRGAEEIAEVVLCHHECPDGSGYPRGLEGDRIPVLARVLRVADVYAALLEARPYKGRMSAADVLSRMRALGGKLDPSCLAALEGLVASGDLADVS